MTDPATILSVRNAIRTCTRCPLSTHTTPVPWSGDLHPDICVIGEAPGRNEAETGEPFIGKAGYFLRHSLRSVGIDDKQVAYVNSCSCYPSRTPNVEEINACRANMRLQVALLQPKYIITVGNVALQSVRGFMKWPSLQLIHGRVMKWPNPPLPADPVAVMATYHPSSAIRPTGKKYAQAIEEDLAGFVEWRVKEEAGESWPSEGCAIRGCEGEFYRWNDWALAMCRRHSKNQGMLFPDDVGVVGVEA